MSDWDRFEHRDLGGAPGLPNIRHQRDHNPMLHAARGTNGDQAGIYKGSPSTPLSSFPNGGAPPLPPGGSRQPAPPAQGEDPSFDAKVAAEYFRLKDAKAPLRDKGPSGSPSGEGGTRGAPPPGAFESDVERAMRELEVEVGLANGTNSRSRYASPSSQPPPPPHPPAVSTRPELSDSRTTGDEGSTLLSQMDMRRVSPGGGKGRPGGLRDMWDNGGGSEGHSTFYGAGQQQQRQGGGGGGSSTQQTQRHGPGLKGMWGGEQPEESVRPKRQGPGLRGLWSGPDMAAADAARSESQAAYMSALNRDAQEKRAFSDEPQGQQQQRRQNQQRQQAHARQDGQYSPYSTSGMADGVSEPGTSLAGIGTPRGGITPRQQRRDLSEGVDGGNSLDRAVDRAKKVAYADELRKQMTEKEARMAMDEDASTSGRRRASTGGRRVGGGGGGGGGDSYNRAPFTPASHGRESYPGHSVPDSNGESPFTEADRAHDRWPSSAWSTPPPGSSSTTNAGEGHVTAARRRLVEDVYGGGGMGAALGGAGYRRASTGSHGVRSVGAGSHSASRPPEQERGGDRGESTAAFEGADGGASQGGSSYLRTGAGVQNLRESEHCENKLQKRAAALEQQRALEAQIAEKARAKRDEEEKRKREEEEESRQQREQQRRLEADAEEGRRRKQAEQQEQLEGLYRQQEEALRKKRGGGRHPNDGGVGKGSHAPAYGGSTSILDADSRERAAPAGYPSNGEVDLGGGLRQSQMQHLQQRRAAGIGGVSGAELATPRRWSNVPDVDDLPAGAQARAQVLRSSPPDRNGGGGTTSTPRAGSASSVRRGSASPAASAASGRLRGASGLAGTKSPAAEGARGRTSPMATAFDRGVGGGAPSGPPLQTSSLLVPVSSPALFPPFPVDNVDGTGAAAAALSREDDRHPMQRSFAASGGVGHPERHPVASSAGSMAGRVAAGPPQDEMDAFVTKWQDEHLRRRGFQGQRQHQQDGVVGVTSPGIANERHNPSSSSSPGGRTICRSPPRSLLRGSPHARGYANGGGGGRVRGSAVLAGKAGGRGELEESLAATSRMVNPPSLPRPPSISHAGGSAGAGGDGRQAQQRTEGGFGGLGGGEDEGAANLSEQSLTSDSILFYLSGQQRQSMAEDATATAPSSPMAAGAGRFSGTNGAELKSRSAGISASRLGLPRESSEVDGGGEGGYGWGRKGSDSAGGFQGVNSSSPRLVGSVQREEGADQGQMSPLTRLLAETPVRFKAPGGLRPQPGVDPTVDGVLGSPAAPSFGPDPQAHRLATGGGDGGTRTRRARPGEGGGAGGSSPDTGGKAAGAARRARALWGAPSAGAATGGRGGVAIAEALTRRGLPWEEMPASEGRASSSGAPLR